MKKATLGMSIMLAILITSLSPLEAAAAPKTDVVVLENGDSVTGEIKSLEFGELRYSTDSMGTVSVEWQEVTSIRSNQSLQVEVASGTRYFGNLFRANSNGSVGVGEGDNVQEIALSHIVRITPIETDEKIWNRMEGSVKFGFDTDKASEVTSGYLNANIRYRALTYLLGLDISSSFTDQPGAPTTENRSLGINYQRFRASRWFTDWFASTEKNDEQGIDQRLSGGGGIGRYLVQNNNNQFSVLAGLVATRETFIGSDPDATNAEGKVEIKYLHRRRDPDSDIILTTDIFPRLDDLSSYRSDSNLTLRRELVEDLFLDLSVYYRYLSDPPVGANSDDYGVITSIGYSF